MSEPKAETRGLKGMKGAGTICNPVLTILKVGVDKSFWPTAIAHVPLAKGDYPLCGEASISWVLVADPDAIVTYEILDSPVFNLGAMPLDGTLDARNPTLKIPLHANVPGAGAVVFYGSDPATSVVIVE